MTKALYRKWRPQNWDEVTAQDHIIQTLKNAVASDRVTHAYLFAGPRGTGKTTTARLLAKAVNCLEPDLKKRPCNNCNHCQALNTGRFMDLIEIDAASNTSVDDVRDLRDKINFSPSQGKYKVYIIDEVHMLSPAAFNALLKTLEEPPPHAIFVLATTEIHKIPATVLSRCQRHEFRRIPVDDIVKHLKEKSKSEGFDVSEAVFKEIARQATGSLRDAISLLDQLTSTDEKITLETAQMVMGTGTNLSVITIVDSLIEKNPTEGLNRINKALDGGSDPRQFARQIVTYLRNVLLHKMGNEQLVETADSIKEKIFHHAQQMSVTDILNAIEAFNNATIEEHASWHPGLPLELAFTSFLVKPEQTLTENKPSIESKPTKETIKQPKTESKQTQKISKKSDAVLKKDLVTKQTKQKESSVKDSEITTINASSPDILPETDHQINDLPGEKVSMKKIYQSWEKIKSMVGKHNPRAEGLLNTCKLAGLKENTLILGFSTETLKEMMNKEGNINLVSDILEEVLGQAMLVKCIVTSKQGSVIPENLKIDQDGMVSTATRDLGGKISSAEEAK